MRVLMMTSMVKGRSLLAIGEETDLPDKTAIRLINRGHAVPVRLEDVEMQTSADVPERAVRRRGRPRKQRHVESN